MKKLIAILMILIFSFEGAGYCLRVPMDDNERIVKAASMFTDKSETPRDIFVKTVERYFYEEKNFWDEMHLECKIYRPRVHFFALGTEKPLVVIDDKFYSIVVNTDALQKLAAIGKDYQVFDLILQAGIQTDRLRQTHYYDWVKKRFGFIRRLSTRLSERLRDIMIYHDRAYFLHKYKVRKKLLTRYRKIDVVNIADIKEPSAIDAYSLQRLLIYLSPSMELDLYQHASILIATFGEEITARLEILKANIVSNSNLSVGELLLFIDREHPFFKAAETDSYLNSFFLPEYSEWFRYMWIYGKIFEKDGLFQDIVLDSIREYERTKKAQVINIGVIGAGYGQEPISVAILCGRMIRGKLKEQGLSEEAVKIKIHILNKPNSVFQKLKNNQVIYSADSIQNELKNRYSSPLPPKITQEDLGLFFELTKAGYRRSAYLNKILEFYDVDLLDRSSYTELPARLAILLVHNVLQHLRQRKEQPGKDREFEKTITVAFRYMDYLLKRGGVFSLANGDPLDPKVTEEHEALFKKSGRYLQIPLDTRFDRGAEIYIKNEERITIKPFDTISSNREADRAI